MKSRISLIALAASAAAVLALSSASAQQPVAPGQGPVTKEELAQNFQAEHEIGHRFHIDPNDLPAPKTGPIVTDRSLIVPFNGQALEVPPGFAATPFAIGLVNPRRLLVLPNGDVLVAEQSAGYLTLLRDDGEGRAKWIDRHVEDLNRPYGLALRGDEILVADQDAIWRVPHIVGNLRAGRPVPPQKADEVPPDQRKPVPGAYGAELLTKKGVFGITVGHQNRHLAIDPKTGALFVGVGSSGNLGVEPEPKATIQRFDADGTNQTTFASGIRNATALRFHPETGELWAVGQERDGLGDNLPSDYLFRVQQGGFYGWPYAYIGRNAQPGGRYRPTCPGRTRTCLRQAGCVSRQRPPRTTSGCALWPLRPRKPFDLATVELDAAAIADAGERSTLCWPDNGGEDPNAVLALSFPAGAKHGR